MSYKLVFDVQTDGLRLVWLILLPLMELFFALVFATGLAHERYTKKQWIPRKL
jgi:hypothetical protein